MFIHLTIIVFIINFSPFVNTSENCTLKNDVAGRCILFEFCPREREFEDPIPNCGNGTFPFGCCESKPEDLIENPFGRLARKECQKNMDDLYEWQSYGLVFGGIDARSAEFVHMAALGYGQTEDDLKYHCGGSLITAKHVLTAAHCLYSADGPISYVLVGDLDLSSSTDDAEPQTIKVLRTIPHPEHRQNSSYHDIAIVELVHPVKFTKWVKPACLDFGQHQITAATPFTATGFGYLNTDGDRRGHLQEVNLIEYNNSICEKAYPVTKKRLHLGLQKSQMCAGGVTEIKDTCQGDSGGPLTINNNDIRYSRYKGYVVVGVTSFGKLCGITNSPGVYTRVKSYIPWIETVVWPQI